MTKILTGSIIFVLLYNLLFYHTGAGIGTGIFFLLLNLYFFLTKSENSRNLNLAISSSIISTLFAFLIGFKSNEIITAINLISAAFFALVSVYFYKLNEEYNFKIPSFLISPIKVLIESVSGFLKLIFVEPTNTSPVDKTKIFPLLRGLFIAVPIVIILTLILILADPIFENYVHNFLSSIWDRILISAIIFTALFSLGLAKIKAVFKEKLLNVSEGKELELMVILSSVVILFASFILVQFKYLFSSPTTAQLAQIGIKSLTYSEYVNKGFFELLVASSIAGALLIYGLKFVHHFSAHKKTILQILLSTLSLETGLILLSDAQRLNLYATDHGLTRARIFGFIFLIWLSSMLIMLLLKTIQNLSSKVIFSLTITITIFTLLLINLVNVDYLIATKYKPTVNNEIDYFYLTSLSPDAYPVWIESLENSQQQILELDAKKDLSSDDNRKLFWARNTLDNLDYHLNHLNQKYEKKLKWQEFNFSEFAAYQYINQNKSQLAQSQSLKSVIEQLQLRLNQNPSNTLQIDRDTAPPLLKQNR